MKTKKNVKLQSRLRLKPGSKKSEKSRVMNEVKDLAMLAISGNVRACLDSLLIRLYEIPNFPHLCFIVLQIFLCKMPQMQSRCCCPRKQPQSIIVLRRAINSSCNKDFSAHFEIFPNKYSLQKMIGRFIYIEQLKCKSASEALDKLCFKIVSK